ncbi:MAG: hypothetical protein FWG13_04085 [Leptospirales bacterium]|nr:hypothetical protein [Leptospirales bacterium]
MKRTIKLLTHGIAITAICFFGFLAMGNMNNADDIAAGQFDNPVWNKLKGIHWVKGSQ